MSESDLTRQDRVRKEVESLRAAAAHVQAEVAALRGRATSPSRSVVVEVDASGCLRDLGLTPNAMRLQPEELSNLIVATLKRAREDAQTQSENKLADLGANKYLNDAAAFVREFTGEATRPQTGERPLPAHENELSWLQERGGSIFDATANRTTGS